MRSKSQLYKLPKEILIEIIYKGRLGFSEEWINWLNAPPSIHYGDEEDFQLKSCCQCQKEILLRYWKAGASSCNYYSYPIGCIYCPECKEIVCKDCIADTEFANYLIKYRNSYGDLDSILVSNCGDCLKRGRYTWNSAYEKTRKIRYKPNLAQCGWKDKYWKDIQKYCNDDE